MLSQLEQACKTYFTESSSGLIEIDSNWQHIFVTALTFRLDQATSIQMKCQGGVIFVHAPRLFYCSIVRKGV